MLIVHNFHQLNFKVCHVHIYLLSIRFKIQFEISMMHFSPNRQDAILYAGEARLKYSDPKDIAAFIARKFNARHFIGSGFIGTGWQCWVISGHGSLSVDEFESSGRYQYAIVDRDADNMMLFDTGDATQWISFDFGQVRVL